MTGIKRLSPRQSRKVNTLVTVSYTHLGKVKVKKLYSPKTGKTYDGTVLLADTGGKYVNYKVTISKDKQLE